MTSQIVLEMLARNGSVSFASNVDVQHDGQTTHCSQGLRPEPSWLAAHIGNGAKDTSIW